MEVVMVGCFQLIVIFKQKTAYEMRISDWSSDVCSSDLLCYYAVAVLKPRLGYDDSLDAFGIHGIGGMIGAIGTGVVYAPVFGGPGDGAVGIGAQVWIQLQAVVTTEIGRAHV